MINRIKSSLELFLIIFVLFLFVVGVSVYGVLGMKKVKSDSHELFTDRMIPMHHLGDIRFFTVKTLFIIQQADKKQISYNDAKDSIEKIQDNVIKGWKGYLHSGLTPEEEQITSNISVLLKNSSVEIKQIKVIFEKNDSVALGSFVKNISQSNLYKILAEVTKLREVQLQMADATVSEILSDFGAFINSLIIILVIIFFLVVPFTYYLINKNSDFISNYIKNSDKLSSAEQKYHSLFENAGDAIFLVNQDLIITESNNSSSELLGYSCEELKGMSVKDLYSSKDVVGIPNRVKILNQEKKLIDEILMKRKDGSEVYAEINRTVLKDNTYLSIVRNISKRKKIEAELHEKTELLQMFVEHSPACLAMLDNDMKYIAFSRRWITGYNIKDKEIVGKSHYEVFPDIPQHWKDIHQRCLQGAIEFNDEDPFLREDGSVEWLKWEIRPWYKVKGEIGGIIMFTELITDRKRADEMFRKQFFNSPDIILYVNKKYKVESINRKYFGGLQLEEIINSNCLEILSEENKETTKKALTKCFATQKNQLIENLLVQERWYRLRFIPIIVSDEVTHIMIFATDITKRKQAELKLKQSEERYRILTENVGDAIIMIDKDLNIIYYNPLVEKISGYTLGHEKLKTVYDLVHPDDYSKMLRFFQDSVESPGSALQNQIRIKNKLGDVIWIEGTVSNLLEKEGVEAFIGNYRDITIRKKLEEQQVLMSSIVNTTDDAIISKDINGIITSWNVGAEKILGYTAKEMIGQNISKLLPPNLNGEEKRILEDIAKGFSIDHYETRRLKKDGTIIDVSLTISPIKDILGKVIGASKIMRDITEQKKYENDLIHFNAELKKTNAELDRFVYSTSHDLRAPLKSMMGLIYMMGEDIDLENTDLHDRLKMLGNSVKKLDDFIEEILRYSRNSRMVLEKNEVDFRKMLEEIKRDHKFSEEIKGVQIVEEINSEEIFISDYNRLSIVLNNIFSNALKYRDFSKDASIVKITINADEKKARIVVEDNGIGITNENQEKIFDMFYRATTQASGSGIGLYIVKEALDKLGGTISVESELHYGTKFIIDVPNQISNLN